MKFKVGDNILVKDVDTLPYAYEKLIGQILTIVSVHYSTSGSVGYRVKSDGAAWYLGPGEFEKPSPQQLKQLTESIKESYAKWQ